MSVFKRCGCGRAYSKELWRKLEYVGTQSFPADEYGPELNLEMRNCKCGSTLCVERTHDDERDPRRERLIERHLRARVSRRSASGRKRRR